VLLVCFRQKRALSIPVQDPMLRQKAEEIAFKLNIEFTPLRGWLDQLRCAGLRYRTMSRKSGSVIEDEVGSWKTGVFSSLLS
jgi:hypothetical protein